MSRDDERIGGTSEPAAEPGRADYIVAGMLVAAGTASLGPAGAVAGAFLTPIAADFLARAHAEWAGERDRKSQILLESAAESAQMSVEDLLERILGDPSKVRLLADAARAAAMADLDSKVRLLGQSLASGALSSDSAVPDEAQLRVSVLADIEGPHLRVLEYIGEHAPNPASPQGTPGGAESEIAEAMPGANYGGSGILQPILRVLDRNGLIFQIGPPLGGEIILDQHIAADDTVPPPGTTRWGITTFGQSILQDFKQAGMTEEQERQQLADEQGDGLNTSDGHGGHPTTR